MLSSVSEKPVVAKNTQNKEAGDWLSRRVLTQLEGGLGLIPSSIEKENLGRTYLIRIWGFLL